MNTNTHFWYICRSILLRIRNVSGKSCREYQNTYFMFGTFFFFNSCPLWDKKFTLEQATKDQKGSIWGWWPKPRNGCFTPGKDPAPNVFEAGWTPGPAWNGEENLASAGIRSPDRPAGSESLYRLRYPGPRLWDMWKNTVQPGWPQMTVWRMGNVSWITKATNIYSEYVLLIGFPLQQWLYERAPMLYVHCLSCLTAYTRYAKTCTNGQHRYWLQS